jgi:DNA invertase Pin-like site-specific DNA recombinase
VSTTKQGISGLGLDAQREAVQAFARQTRRSILAEFVEIESGRVKDRPQLLAALAECRRTKATLLIARLDRLARNVAFVSSIMEAGVEFVATDAPFANRLMVHILAAFAEHERELISQRTKAALAAAKARGVVLGANGTKLAERASKAAVEAAEAYRDPIQQIMATGVQSARQIAMALNAAGVPSRAGGRWHSANVLRTMKRLGLIAVSDEVSTQLEQCQ